MSQRSKTPRQSKPQIFGPVENLEKHLQPDWWKKIFNAMYLKTDADVVEDQEITRAEVDLFISILGLQPDMAVLDLACGQGRHVLELARRGFTHVYGLDRSYFLIRRARSISTTEGLKASFKEGDARKLPFTADSFDVVTILGNSFGYFENPEDDMKILSEVFRVLKPNGKFLLDITDGNYVKNNFSPRSWEWIDNKHFVCRERSLSENQERLVSREVVTNVSKGVMVDQFYAERLYSAESLEKLLKSRHYQDIVFHGNLKPDSKRNQDLGMMEQRIIVSSKVVKEWTPKKARSVSVKNIAVIMGDPSRKDIIKPDAVFDSDDYNTIEQLKSALGSLKEYKFTYLNNHSTLISDLTRHNAKFDFVLN